MVESRRGSPQRTSPSSQSPVDEQVDSTRMPFGDHLDELRGCLIRSLIGIGLCAIVSMMFAKRILVVILAPAIAVLEEAGEAPTLLALSPAAPFIIYLKAGFLTGGLAAAPWVIIQIWRFVSVGLYDRERRFVKRLLPITIALFAAGVTFMFFIVYPMVLRFFIIFNQALDIDGVPLVASQFGVQFVVSMVFSLALGFGIAFELPVVVVFLAVTGIVPTSTMRSARRYVVFAIFLTAAVLTPPDVISQCLLAGPMYLLFEGGLIVARRMESTRTQK